MSEEKKNSKRELGWLSDRGQEKLNRILDAYCDIKTEENNAKSADDPTKLSRIRRDQPASLLAADTDLHRQTIGKIISRGKKGGLAYKSIGIFFDKLYEFFNDDNFPERQDRVDPNDLILDEYNDIVEFEEFIQGPTTSNISSQDWHTLFKLLQNVELKDVISACRQAFSVCKGSDFSCHRPELNQLNTLEDVKDILSEIDEPKVAVEFANAAERYATGSIRDEVIQWRDRLAQQYGITSTAPEPAGSQQSISVYLLITLKPRGSGDVLLGASLHLENPEEVVSNIIPIEINANSDAEKWISCPLDRVPEYLPKFITRAEQCLLELKVYVPPTLEIFLPYDFLDHRVDQWEIDEELDGEANALVREYPVVVRSLDRFDRTQKPKLLRELGNRWNLLREAIRNSRILPSFYSLNDDELDELDYPNLKLALEERVGLKCCSQLPQDERDRRQLFKCILTSGIPVTMWLYVPQTTPQETLEAFDRLLTAENLSDFCCFGQQIRRVRCKKEHPLQHIGLLWDCPHREPPLPSVENPLEIPK